MIVLILPFHTVGIHTCRISRAYWMRADRVTPTADPRFPDRAWRRYGQSVSYAAA